MLFYLIPAIVFMLSLRFYAAYRSKRDALITDADSIVHLAYLKEYYRTKGKPIDISYLYTLDTSDYPNGFHKLFYYLRVPVSWLEKNGGYLPAIFDSIMLVLIAGAMNLYGGSHYEWILLFPFLRLFFYNEGRAHHFSERAYGVLWGNAYLFSVAAYFVSDNSNWLVLAIIPFTMFSISSVFTWQATFFISVLLSLITLNPLFVLIYGAMMLISFVITGGYSLKVLKGLIRHCFFYKTYLSPRYFGLRDHILELFRFRGIRSYLFMLYTNAPLRLLTDVPFLALIGYALYQGMAFDFWMQWILAGVLLVFMMSTQTLKFLGEPERYLEYVIIPFFIALSQISFFDYPVVALLCAIITGVVFVAHWYLYFTNIENTVARQQDLISLREFFSGIENKNVLTISFRLSFFLGYENIKNRFVTLFANIGAKEKGQEYRWLIFDRYPYVRSDLPEVIKRYDLDIIAVEKARAQEMNRTFDGKYYDFSPYKVLYENSHYMVLDTRT